MPLYSYRAVRSDGTKLEGTIDAVDKNYVISFIRQQGYMPIKIEIQNNFKFSLDKIYVKKIPLKDIAIFCRQFSTILLAGVSIIMALNILKNQTSNKSLQIHLNKVLEDIQKGRILSESLKNYRGVFPELMINMIEAGELSGTLDSTMKRLADHYEKENKISKKIKSAMAYPLILSFVSITLMIFMVYFILPKFIAIIQSTGGQIPKITQIVMSFTHFMQSNWYIVFISVISLVILIYSYTRRGNGRLLYHKILLRVPVLGNLIRKIIATRFTRTLSILLASGIPILSALDSAEAIVRNAIAENDIKGSIVDVRNGQGLSQPLGKSKVFETMVVQMIKIGEDTGSLDSMLSKTADFYDEEVDSAITQLVTLLEPLMVVIMGLVIAFLLISVMLPMANMLNI